MFKIDSYLNFVVVLLSLSKIIMFLLQLGIIIQFRLSAEYGLSVSSQKFLFEFICVRESQR